MGLIEALRPYVEDLQYHAGEKPSWSVANCPDCGRRKDGRIGDRLVIWPDKRGGKGEFWCRRCKIQGDGIKLLRLYGVPFPDAYRAVVGELPPDNWTLTGKRSTRTKPKPKPKPPEPANGGVDLAALARERTQQLLAPPAPAPLPPATWRAEATALWRRARERLWTDREAMEWLRRRGIADGVAWASGVCGWLPHVTPFNGSRLPAGLLLVTLDNESGDVICASVHTRDPSQWRGIKHQWAAGVRVRSVVLRPSVEYSSPPALVMESGLDALLAWQESNMSVLAVGVGSSAWNPDRAADDLISACEHVIFVPDADEAGRDAASRWKRRWPTGTIVEPVGGKDISEAHATALAGRPGAMTAAEWLRHALAKAQKPDADDKNTSPVR